ncbi:MAG TPA: hypothetical protein VM052_02920 [Candidatus Limnocylindrales bacterium]|nr:hypothetical protein [Candidatus Limnocylindrales bacterium]
MSDASNIRRVALLSFGFLLIRWLTAFVVGQPGYTDAYYYVDVASRFARGLGLTADFVWSPIELGTLPVVSHRFWMPVATWLQAGGIAALGSLLGEFRAAQAAVIVIAGAVPPVTYACARSLAAGHRAALAAAAIAGLGGLFAPAWVTLDGFAAAALVGSLFFLAFARAAAGDVRAGIACGALVGLLYLTRTEGALFGLALVALAMRRPSRSAGLAGALVALAVGVAWLARNASIGTPPDLIARATLLVRYEEFFAVSPPTLAAFTAALPAVIGAKLGALASNAGTFIFAFCLVLIPALAFGGRRLWSRLDVRAWSALALVVFLAQSLLFTLHSTRGSYFHSLGAFFPFGVALAAAGGERLLAERRPAMAGAWTWGTLVLVAVFSAGAVSGWDSSFNTPARARADAVSAIPDGPFLAIDAAAWRWISGRSVIVTPSDGLAAARCLVAASGARSIVLEEAHFSQYDALYRGESRPDWLGAPVDRGTVRIFAVTAPVERCA